MRKTETFEQPRLTEKKTTRLGRGQLRKPVPTSVSKKCAESGTFEDVRLSTAVADALRAGKAGANPVSLLEELYERIGFSVLNRHEEEGKGFRSLPTSPKREKARDIPEARNFRDEEVDYYGVVTPPRLNSSRREYSFAHSPTRRPVSIAERSPNLLRRLENFESQLNKEKTEVQRRYKTIVQRVRTARGYVKGYSFSRFRNFNAYWSNRRILSQSSKSCLITNLAVIHECGNVRQATSIFMSILGIHHQHTCQYARTCFLLLARNGSIKRSVNTVTNCDHLVFRLARAQTRLSHVQIWIPTRI